MHLLFVCAALAAELSRTVLLRVVDTSSPTEQYQRKARRVCLRSGDPEVLASHLRTAEVTVWLEQMMLGDIIMKAARARYEVNSNRLAYLPFLEPSAIPLDQAFSEAIDEWRGEWDRLDAERLRYGEAAEELEAGAGSLPSGMVLRRQCRAALGRLYASSGFTRAQVMHGLSHVRLAGVEYARALELIESH
jgi:hypothetical protein